MIVARDQTKRSVWPICRLAWTSNGKPKIKRRAKRRIWKNGWMPYRKSRKRQRSASRKCGNGLHSSMGIIIMLMVQPGTHGTRMRITGIIDWRIIPVCRISVLVRLFDREVPRTSRDSQVAVRGRLYRRLRAKWDLRKTARPILPVLLPPRILRDR